jgi:hypothetical protein
LIFFHDILGGEAGSADTARDPRGFAMKFYTEDGNWDCVGNNTPIFFIRDPILVSHLIFVYHLKLEYVPVCISFELKCCGAHICNKVRTYAVFYF